MCDEMRVGVAQASGEETAAKEGAVINPDGGYGDWVVATRAAEMAGAPPAPA